MVDVGETGELASSFVNHYEVLGVGLDDRTCSILCKANQLLVQTHPDLFVHADKKEKERLQETTGRILAAKRVIGDDARRQDYNGEHRLRLLLWWDGATTVNNCNSNLGPKDTHRDAGSHENAQAWSEKPTCSRAYASLANDKPSKGNDTDISGPQDTSTNATLEHGSPDNSGEAHDSDTEDGVNYGNSKGIVQGTYFPDHKPRRVVIASLDLRGAITRTLGKVGIDGVYRPESGGVKSGSPVKAKDVLYIDGWQGEPAGVEGACLFGELQAKGLTDGWGWRSFNHLWFNMGVRENLRNIRKRKFSEYQQSNFLQASTNDEKQVRFRVEWLHGRFRHLSDALKREYERGDDHAYGAVLEHGIDQLVLEIAEAGERFAKQRLLENIERDRSLKLKGLGS